jgi:hypothetical protein
VLTKPAGRNPNAAIATLKITLQILAIRLSFATEANCPCTMTTLTSIVLALEQGAASRLLKSQQPEFSHKGSGCAVTLVTERIIQEYTLLSWFHG